MDPSVIFYQLASVIALGVALVAAVNLFWGTDIALAQSDAETKLQEFADHIDDIACQGEQVRSGFLPPESFRLSNYDFSSYETLQVQGANELQVSTPTGEDIPVETDCANVYLCDPGVPIEECTSDDSVPYNEPGQIGFSFEYTPQDGGTVKLQRQAQVDEEGPYIIHMNDSGSTEDPNIKGVSVTTGQTFDFYEISIPEEGGASNPRFYFQGSLIGKTGDLGQGHESSVLIGNETELYRINIAGLEADPAFEVNPDDSSSKNNIQDIGGIGDIMDATPPTDAVVIDGHNDPEEWDMYSYSICALNIGEGESKCTNLTDLGLESDDEVPRVGAVVNAGHGPEATFIQSGEYDNHPKPYLYFWDGSGFRNETISTFDTCDGQDIFEPSENTERNVTIYDIGGTVNADAGFGYDDQDLIAAIENDDGNQQLGYIKLQGECAYTAHPISGTQEVTDDFDDMRVGYPGEQRIPYAMDDWDGELRYYHLLEQEDRMANDTEGDPIRVRGVSSVLQQLVP